jgi:hypothetical protein
MISRSRAWSEILDSVPDQLTELYKYLLQRIDSFKLKVDSEDCKNVLVAATLAYQNLSLSEIAVLAKLPTEKDVKETVELCGSFFTIRGKTVYMIHQSAKEHLRDHLLFRQNEQNFEEKYIWAPELRDSFRSYPDAKSGSVMLSPICVSLLGPSSKE